MSTHFSLPPFVSFGCEIVSLLHSLLFLSLSLCFSLALSLSLLFSLIFCFCLSSFFSFLSGAVIPLVSALPQCGSAESLRACVETCARISEAASGAVALIEGRRSTREKGERKRQTERRKNGRKRGKREKREKETRRRERKRDREKRKKNRLKNDTKRKRL